MAKQISENQLTDIVSKTVRKVLREWIDGDMPGLSKNPKVAAAQQNAEIRPVGKGGRSAWLDYLRRNGGCYDESTDIDSMISAIEYGDEEELREAGFKFAKFLRNNAEAIEKVKHALTNMRQKHFRDYRKWNPKEIAETKKR